MMTEMAVAYEMAFSDWPEELGRQRACQALGVGERRTAVLEYAQLSQRLERIDKVLVDARPARGGVSRGARGRVRDGAHLGDSRKQARMCGGWGRSSEFSWVELARCMVGGASPRESDVAAESGGWQSRDASARGRVDFSVQRRRVLEQCCP